jgi:hypothetical protein
MSAHCRPRQWHRTGLRDASVGGVLLWLLWRGRLPSRWMGLIAVAALLAVAPYVALFVQYGSPAPRTPGQIAMIKSGALAVGWDSAERMTPASYAAHFVSEFVMEWMPTLKPRHALNYAALTIPITAALCAFVGFLVAVQRIGYEKAGPLDIVVAAGTLAFAASSAMSCIPSSAGRQPPTRATISAGGYRSTRGVVIAGRNQTAVRPRHPARLPDCRPLVFCPLGAPLG